MIIGDLAVGSFIRDPSKYKNIMVVEAKNLSSSVQVCGYDPIKKVKKSNFRFLNWDQVVEKASI